jgi:hypothetical protein
MKIQTVKIILNKLVGVAFSSRPHEFHLRTFFVALPKYSYFCCCSEVKHWSAIRPYEHNNKNLDFFKIKLEE